MEFVKRKISNKVGQLTSLLFVVFILGITSLAQAAQREMSMTIDEMQIDVARKSVV